MKFSTSPRAVLNALKLANIGSRPTRVGDDSVIIDAQDSVVFVRRAFEHECHTLGASIPVSDGLIEDTGSVSLRSNVLLRILKQFEGDEVTFETNPGGGELSEYEVAEGGYCSIRVGDIDINLVETERPELLEIERTGVTPVAIFDAAHLAGVLRRLLPSIAEDYARPALTFVNMVIRDDQATFVAADGFRLAVDKLPTQSPVLDASVLLPRDALVSFLRLLKRPRDDAKIHIASRTQAVLAPTPVVSISSSVNQIPGGLKWPDWEKLIPDADDAKGEFVFGIAHLNQLVNIARIVSQYGTGAIKFNLNDDRELIATVDAADIFGGLTAKLTANVVKGKDSKIGFNARFLKEFTTAARAASRLDRIPVEDIRLRMTETTESGLFTLEGLPEFKQVIMPMYVQWSRLGEADV